jgi:FAD/FMN-containing dehydrogenase
MGGGPSNEMREAGAAATTAFRDGFGGTIVLPGDPGYDRARAVWNAVADLRPAVVARCGSPADVVAAVRFAREHDLVVAVRGGGHSVAGFSTCDGGVVVDLSGMRGARVDQGARTARVAGGALLSELDVAAQAAGLACPVGVVGHTGVGGLTLGGGMGRLMRRHGLTLDNLLSAEVVTADGRVVRAAPDEHPELFWGLRGAGANFGVVTSFEFRLHPVGPVVTQGAVRHGLDRAWRAASSVAELAATGPDHVFLGLNLTSAEPGSSGPAVSAGALHAGTPEDAERDLAPLRDAAAVEDSIAPRRYLDVQLMNDDAMAWGKRFYMKGAYLPFLTEELVETCAGRVAAAPPDCEISFWALGGAVGRVPEDATAFTGRGAAFWLGVECLWQDPARDDEYVAWGRAAMGALQPFTTSGHYVNDMVESGEAVVRSVYGDAKYERLVALKRDWDPDNVFRRNQNVAP